MTGVKTKDKISLTGVLVLALTMICMDFVVFRPNRILKGENFSALEILGGNFYLLLLLILLVLLLVLVKKDRGWLNLLTGLAAGIFIPVVFYMAGSAAGGLAAGAPPYARVSLGGGVWGAVLGAYMVVAGSCRRGGQRSWLKFAVKALPLVAVVLLLLAGELDNLSIMKEYFNRSATFLAEFHRHLTLAFSSVALGAVVGVLLGFVIFKYSSSEKIIFLFINLAQTVPTLSLLGLLMIPLAYLGERFALFSVLGIRGVGWAPAFVALFLYALLPVTGNTLAGLRTVNQQVIEAARGMGMNAGQVFWKVQLPLTFPVILSGIRTALTQSIGNTILAGLIGGGGLGTIIFLGLAQAAPDLILLGAIPVVFLALLADAAMVGLVGLFARRRVRGAL